MKIEQCGGCDIGRCFRHGNISSLTPREIASAFGFSTRHDPHRRDCRRFEAAKEAMGKLICSGLSIIGEDAIGYVGKSQSVIIAKWAVKYADALLAELEI